jgi:hypothetical protein
MIEWLSQPRRERRQLLDRIEQRRLHLGQLRQDCRREGMRWARSPRAPVQAFVAGFMLDQLRPLLPASSSPLKLSLIMAFRRLELLVRQVL